MFGPKLAKVWCAEDNGLRQNTCKRVTNVQCLYSLSRCFKLVTNYKTKGWRLSLPLSFNWDVSSTNTVHATNAVRGHTSRMWVIILKQERGNGDQKTTTELTQIRNCNIYITGLPYVGRRQFISCVVPRSTRSSSGTRSLFMSVSQDAVE